jgi:hypothetical protein
MKSREMIGVWLMIQSLLTATVYLVGIWYIRRSTSKRYEEWDLNTTTISDYTVKYEIPKSVYQNFYDEHINDNEINSNHGSDVSAMFERDSVLYAFKKHLKRNIEDKLTYMNQVTDDQRNIIKVSEINFIFENTPVVNMLIDRGNALDVLNDDKAQRIENRIKEHLM